MNTIYDDANILFKAGTPLKKHILLADDEGPLRHSIKLMLRQVGYKVTAVPDGASALKTVMDLLHTTEYVDLVMTDLNMDGMSGQELIEALRNSGVQVPVLVITGFGSKDTVVHLLQMGCTDYIDKPLHPNEIIKRVDRILKRWDEQERTRHIQAEQEKVRQAKWQETLTAYREKFRQLTKQLFGGQLDYTRTLNPSPQGLQIKLAYRNSPQADQGGAFIDIQNTPDGCDLFMADVPGVDMSASLHNLLMKAFFEENCRTGYPGDSFLQLLNRQLRESELAGRRSVALFIRVNLQKMTADIISSGHPYPIKTSRGAPFTNAIITHGEPLGTLDSISFENRSINLAYGDRLFLFSEGLLKAASADASTGAGYEIIERLIVENASLQMTEQLDAIWTPVLQQTTPSACSNLLLVGLEIPDDQWDGEMEHADNSKVTS